MSDPKKPGDLGDVDWDQALSEWEATNFSPEVAKEVPSEKAGTPAAASRPLYRPPTAPAGKGKGKLPSILKAYEDDEGAEATRIARIPEELLRRQGEGSTKMPVADLVDVAGAEAHRPQVRPAPEPPRESEGSVPRGPALLVPQLRKYDPNEVTEVGKASQFTRPRAIDAPSEHPAVAAAVDIAIPAATTRPPAPPAPLPPPRTWADEKLASEWLPADKLEEMQARATWLEAEARALDGVEGARGLLACSELLAMSGARERAYDLAVEARSEDQAPALAHWQARGLASGVDQAEIVASLDAEAQAAPTEAARTHASLLAAETLRAAGEHDAAGARFDDIAELAADDARAALARAMRALAGDGAAGLAAELPQSPGLTPLAQGLATVLRLRGVNTRASGTLEHAANEVLLQARQALDRGDVADAAARVAQLSAIPEISAGAKWLAASLGAVRAARRNEAARWLQDLSDRGDDQARRALVARALELGDAEMARDAIMAPGALTSAERITIAALAGLPLSATDPHLDATAATPGMSALAAAVTALAMPADADRDAQAEARSQRTAGSDQARAHVRLGRLLAASAGPAAVEGALAGVGDTYGAVARALALEGAARTGHTAEVSSALEAWGAGWGSREEGAIGAVAAALTAEWAGETARALDAFKAARNADPTLEAALRAIASLESADLVTELNDLAQELGDGLRGALARIEAATRGEAVLPEPARAHMLKLAHEAAPPLPIASFLAERIARRAGDVDEVLRWIRERRADTTDAVEVGLDAVREALLVADRDPQLAAERLRDAQRSRPEDLALRDLYDRLASDPPDARAAWREQRAASANGEGRTLLLLEAAHEFERAGDDEGALRCAEAAGAGDAGLGAIARERAELGGPRVARLAEDLLAAAKGAADPRARREAYERLAVIDATSRQDGASAVLWHRAILEETPHHEPSLRHLEQHLIGEGRDEELEPIAAGVAAALRGTGPGEGPAHAELAARLHLRAPEARWDGTREMVDLASSEREPSLWALRMKQAHARAAADDEAFLTATLRLLDRSSSAVDRALFLTQAGDAALRLGRTDQAQALLVQATGEDPGDVLTWQLLVSVRRAAGDHRGTAEAFEALARSSLVPEEQLSAWREAGRIFLDEARDEERGMSALEAAAAIDVAFEDVFVRLSAVYASRKMPAELGALLERRIATVTDPDERLALEVRRGRVLLDAGDVDGARRAFEAALAERPEDSGALSAFADLCAAQKDWAAAEQALVRLARLLPTPEEQRSVYAKLGDLYSAHLSNLSRAEVAYREVLKRTPDDVPTMEKLVDIHKRQNDPARAVELQTELVGKSRGPEEKRRRLLELATIHEQSAHDNRRAEQTLEAARREFPQDVGVLRTLAEFYIRHHQAPAVNILLDRASGDARRAIAAGRLTPALFDILATVFDLREKKDAARVTRSLLAALSGQPAEMAGAGPRAFDSRLDDRLAPEALTPSLRTLFAKTGDALDHLSPIDLRAQKAVPLAADAPLSRLAASIGQVAGLGAVQVHVSPRLGSACVPVSSSPPVIAIGEALAGHERSSMFLVVRALKLVHARAAVLARAAPSELKVFVPAWLQCFNPTWTPQGVTAAQLKPAGDRIQAALPRNLDADTAIIALEVAGTIGTRADSLGASAIAWANRVALLALGDTNAAIDAIAMANGEAGGAPRDAKERAAWIARTPEACDLIAFAVTDAFAETRARLGLDS